MTDASPQPDSGEGGTTTTGGYGTPRLRIWELSPNSTRYDKLLAAPSDETLTRYWVAWAVIISLVFAFSLIVCLGIVTSRRARKNAFNFYLVYLAIPDLTFCLLCGITCSMNAAKNSYWSEWMCRLQYWYVVFGISSNVWLNTIIVKELYTMVKSGHVRRKYKIPTRRKVSLQAGAVYICCAFLGTWGFYVPHVYTEAPSGLACTPVAIDPPSTAVFWIILFPLLAGIPTVYVIYVSIDVWRRKLLPPTKTRTRLIVTYFARLVLVFFVMWIPTLVIIFVIPSFTSPLVHFLGGTWSHLQGAVSAGVSLMKPDVYHAVKNFVTCNSWSDFVEDICCCGSWGHHDNYNVDNDNNVEDNGRRLNPRRGTHFYPSSWSNLPSWSGEGGSTRYSGSHGGEHQPVEQQVPRTQNSHLPDDGGTGTPRSLDRPILTESHEAMSSTIKNSFISGTSDRSLSSHSAAGEDGCGVAPANPPSPQTLPLTAMNLSAESTNHVNNIAPDTDCDGSVSSQGYWPSQDETRDGDNGEASDRTTDGT